MTVDFLHHCKRLYLSMLIILIGSAAGYSQKKLSGNLNQPKAHVTAISGTDKMTVDDITGFNPNDTVMVIQMQGVGILAGISDYGNINAVFGKPGTHEFMIVQSVTPIIGLTGDVQFKRDLLPTAYDIRGNIQIVRVPYYDFATVTGTLTCDPWDSNTKKGGVLALIIGRSLKLNADIDVSGKGFKGGADLVGDGICAQTAPTTTNRSYPLTFTNAGLKGEGLALHDDFGILLFPANAKGKGPNFTGGGGGNGRYSGGGGGSNSGAGGDGGFESNSCAAPLPGGLGGIKAEQLSFPSLVNRLYLGGGGGASTSLSGLSQPGGNGGGIVIIVTDTIVGNSHRIVSNGGNGGLAVANGGSGGGGAGGSIALSLTSYGSTNLTLSVTGGNGGDNPGSFGEGGGGGGGLVYVNTNPTANVLITNDGGNPGNFSNQPSNPALPGETGVTKPSGFKAILNGFLFNSIRSSVSVNQIDSVCSVPGKPPKITGTIPVGGIGPYTYVWEKSYDALFTAPIILTNDPDPTNYSPSKDLPETQTVWFRRIITDSSPTALTDISKSVQIIVHPFIRNNHIISNPDTICYHGDPLLLTQGIPDLIVPTNKYLKYIWQDSIIGGHWGLQLTAATAKEFDPAPAGVLTVDTWYRRTVISGSCIDKGPASIAKITVLPKLQNNAFSKLNDTICFGGNTNLNMIPGLTGGLSTDYRFKWETSTTGTSGPWSAVGVTTQDFDPDLSVNLPVGDHFYRRTVYSGELNACTDITNPVAVRKVWPVITNNAIKSDQTIGYDSIPQKLIELSGIPNGGDGVKYSYRWVRDTVTFPTAPLGSNGISSAQYQPPNLIRTLSFRRLVNSSVCASTSNSVKIIVDKPIINSISLANSSLDIIYEAQISSKLQGSVPTGGSGVPGDYSFKWYKSLTGSNLLKDWILVSDSSRISFFPGNLNITTWFRRDVGSPLTVPRSIYQSNYIKVIVLPKMQNVNISASQAICFGTRPSQIKGAPSLSGGDGTYKFTWQDSTTSHTWQNISGLVHCDSAGYKPPALTTETKYKRIVYSGKNDCGVETSNTVRININPLPVAPYAGPDTTIYSIGKIYHMEALKPLSIETGAWSTLDNGSGQTDDPASFQTIVRNLSQGKNSFLWTVSRGPCSLMDSVNIELLKDFYPQGFSPNSDGINETFNIEGLNATDYFVDMTVVNSAGTEVYSFSNRNQEWKDWDGKNNNGVELAQGTYYYLVKMTSKSTGKVLPRKSGFIILKRY